MKRLVSGILEKPEVCRQQPSDERCLSDVQKWLLANFGDRTAATLDKNTGAKGVPIVYVNGITTTRDEADTTAADLVQTYNVPVHAVWNPTDDFWPDISQVQFVNKTNAPDVTTTEVVRNIRRQLIARGRVRVVGHSQGATIVSSALSFLTPEELAKVDVLTFGGAALQYPRGTRSLRVVVNVRDVVPWAAGYIRAGKSNLPTPGIERVSFGGVQVWDPSETHSISKYLEVERETRKRTGTQR